MRQFSYVKKRHFVSRPSTSVVGRGTVLQAARSQVRFSTKYIFFSIYPIVPAALGPGDYSASNRNEYQKQKNNVSGE
jgi:hypothetical protein